jgi:outer membrane protein assembly factor BamB
MNFLTLFTTALFFAPAPSPKVTDWPEFRGPDGQGHVTEGKPPLEWGSDKNLVWKRAIPGLGWSSPVVVNGRIYLTTADPLAKGTDEKANDGYSLLTLCVNAATGEIVWSKEIFREPADAPKPYPKNSHASPTPLVYDGKIYVHFGHMGTACLDLDGKVLWRAENKYKPVHGNGGTPILVDNHLIFSCDGGDQAYIVALDSKTGKEVWKTNRDTRVDRKFSFSTPLLITVDGKKQVISPFSNAVCAYDPATGKEIWRVGYDGYSVIPRPVFGNGLVYIVTGYNSPSLLAIRPDGKGDVTTTHVAWKTSKNVPHTPSLLLDGEDLFMVSDSGVFSCLKAKTGEVVWSERHAGNQYSASPILVDGKIYLTSEQGVGTVLEAGPQYKLLARSPLKERTFASFAVVGKALFIRTESNLYRFEVR